MITRKKAIYILLALVLVFNSCSTDNDTLSTESEILVQLENIPEEILKVGQCHNQALDLAFKSIRNNYSVATRNGEKRKFTKDELLAISKQAVYDFCKQNEYFGYNLAFHQNVLESQIAYKNELTRSDNHDTSYSLKLQEFMSKLEKSISNLKAKDLKCLKFDIESLALEARKALSEKEFTAFCAGATTAYASMEYWTKNYQKWQVTLNYPKLAAEFSDDELNDLKIKNGKLASAPRTRGWWDDAWSMVGETWESVNNSVEDWWQNGGGKEVVGDDAGGAVAGAITGAIAAGSATGGSGVVGGAATGAITGAAMSSIESAISHWVQN